MRILSNNAFLAFNTILGLVVNLLTLGGIVFGVIELKPGWGPLSKPGPVLTLLYVFMVIVWLLIALLVLRRRKLKGKIVAGKYWQDAFANVMYSITVPTSVVWILAWGELLGWPKSGPMGDADFAMAFFVSAGAAVLGGGWLSSKLALDIDHFFNPEDYGF